MIVSMEGTLKWSLVVAIAPIAWGSTYFVTRQFLPDDIPLWGAVLRALPAGLLLLALRRRRPRGAWWWRSVVLGTLNMGAFFALVYIAAQLLPTSIASTVMATSPMVMMLFAWLLVSERLRALSLAGAVIGLGGVVLMLVTDAAAVDLWGVLASIAAMSMSSFGYILAKRWGGDVDVLSLTSWQLIAGGAMLVPVAFAWEGAPPALDVGAIAAFAFVSVVATALAFVAWFSGLRHLPAGTVGLIGLLNPVTGVLLGVFVAGETLSTPQIVGLALVFAGIVMGQPLVERGLRRWRVRATRVAAPPQTNGISTLASSSTSRVGISRNVGVR
jgi:probable blue pigment (indigoidine) exporter